MKKFLIILSIFVLSSCQLLQEREAVIVTDKINVCGSAPAIDPIVMREVKPIITKDEFGNVWVSMSSKHYQNISLNMQSILSHIKQRKAVEEFYKSCFKMNK